MTNYSNMKIEINENQKLEDVVVELKRLGYRKDDTLNDCPCYVHTFEDGTYFVYMGSHRWNENPTTLAELKEMNSENY